jgi:hypothetical protein
MISYPFFSDQPGLARRCQELGLAVPLVEELRGRVRPADVNAALECVAAGRRRLLASLAQARRWELKTIRARGVVVDRIVDLMRQPQTTRGAGLSGDRAAAGGTLGRRSSCTPPASSSPFIRARA